MVSRILAALLATLVMGTGVLADHDRGQGRSGHGQGLYQSTNQDENDDGDDGDDEQGEDQPGQSAPTSSSSDQDDALDAVTRGRAIPLEELLARIEGTLGGEIIDARLILVNGTLLYEIKVLSADSQTVSRYYYNARSGRRVRTN